MPYNKNMKHERKRLFIGKNTGSKERLKLITLALENGCDTLVFSLDDAFFKSKIRNQKYIKLAKKFALNIEAGGHDLPLLMPKRLFLFNRNLFRMVQGKRVGAIHFCPTNPKTISIISERANRLFSRAIQWVTTPRIFHLLPEKGHENTWCQCPACRAFRPSEQYLIAVNATADILARFDSSARLLYVEFDTEPEAARIKPRPNTLIGQTLSAPA